MLILAAPCAASDANPPTTTALYSGSTGSNGWNTSSVNLTLSASDDDSGVNYTSYDLDGTGWRNYTGKITISSDGLHTVQYHSVDLANNTEATKNLSIRIDKTAPSIDIEQTNGSMYGTGSVRISWTAYDATSGLDYFEVFSDGALFDHLDNSTREDRVTNLAGGWHNVTVRAHDLAGNIRDQRLTFQVFGGAGDSGISNDIAIVLVIAIVVVATAVAIVLLRRRTRPPGSDVTEKE